MGPSPDVRIGDWGPDQLQAPSQLLRGDHKCTRARRGRGGGLPAGRSQGRAVDAAEAGAFLE